MAEGAAPSETRRWVVDGEQMSRPVFGRSGVDAFFPVPCSEGVWFHAFRRACSDAGCRFRLAATCRSNTPEQVGLSSLFLVWIRRGDPLRVSWWRVS